MGARFPGSGARCQGRVESRWAGTGSDLTFQNDERFEALLRDSLRHLRPAEAQRRMFLVVSITFHGIADVCRASETTGISRPLQNRSAMFAQVALSIETLLAAPALG